MPLAALTSTVTGRGCAERMLVDDGVTLTAGIGSARDTVTKAVPDEKLKLVALSLSGVYLALRVSDPAARRPAGMTIVAAPSLSAVAADE